MNVDKLNQKQCETIIANNYLGKATKTGKQKDYSDYSFAIDMRLWDLKDRTRTKKLIAVMNHVAPITPTAPITPVTPVAPITPTAPVTPTKVIPLNLSFYFPHNKWAKLAHNLTQGNN